MVSFFLYCINGKTLRKESLDFCISDNPKFKAFRKIGYYKKKLKEYQTL